MRTDAALVLVAALAACQPQVARPEPPATLAIVDATVLTSPSGPVLEHATVVIRGGSIVAVGVAAQLPAHATVIDGAGKFVTAGFWNAHVHFAEAAFANAASRGGRRAGGGGRGRSRSACAPTSCC